MLLDFKGRRQSVVRGIYVLLEMNKQTFPTFSPVRRLIWPRKNNICYQRLPNSFCSPTRTRTNLCVDGASWLKKNIYHMKRFWSNIKLMRKCAKILSLNSWQLPLNWGAASTSLKCFLLSSGLLIKRLWRLSPEQEFVPTWQLCTQRTAAHTPAANSEFRKAVLLSTRFSVCSHLVISKPQGLIDIFESPNLARRTSSISGSCSPQRLTEEKGRTDQDQMFSF